MDMKVGDNKAIDEYRMEKYAFRIDSLPITALRHLFKFLRIEDQRCMRLLCKGMQNFVELDYGIHACLPSRCSLDAATTTTTTVINSLKEKIIRSLTILEIYPDYNPLPFITVINLPWNLLSVSLEYIDAELIFNLLAHCRNLGKLHYSTGLDRPLTRPRPIPRQGQDILEFLLVYQPMGKLQLEKLTFLSLRLEKILAYNNSDWVNVAVILLVLAQNTIHSLKRFRIVTVLINGMSLNERLQIIACIGHFLGQCPHLKEFKYIDDIWSGCGGTARRREHMYPSGIQRPCLEPFILATLIENYGSPLLQRTQELEALEDIGVLDLRVRDIMRDAGRKLGNLEKIHLQWGLERVMFECLLIELTSIRQIVIYDQSLKSLTHNGRYNWLFGQDTQQNNINLLFCKSVQKICLSRAVECNKIVVSNDTEDASISLPKMLNFMMALKELQIVPKQPCRRRWKLEPEFYKYETRRDLNIPDISFGEEIKLNKFHKLEILKLEGVKITTLASSRLIQISSLKELYLGVIPEDRHSLFGIKSVDLLKLIGTLRKLEKVSVNMIQFPKEDVNLKSIQLDAFNRIGGMFSQMHRFVDSPDQKTKLMDQYKFTFLFEE